MASSLPRHTGTHRDRKDAARVARRQHDRIEIQLPKLVVGCTGCPMPMGAFADRPTLIEVVDRSPEEEAAIVTEVLAAPPRSC